MRKLYSGLNRFSKIFFWTFSFHVFLIFSFLIQHLFVGIEPKKKIKVYQIPLKAEKVVFQQEVKVKPTSQLTKSVEKKGSVKSEKAVVKSQVTTPSKGSKKVEAKKTQPKKAEPKKVDAHLVSKIQEECNQI